MSKTHYITEKIPILWLIVAVTWGLILFSYLFPDVDWSLIILLLVTVLVFIAVSDWGLVSTEKTQRRSRNLTEIRRIGPKLSEKLKATGIKSVKELATFAPKELAEKIGISEETASRWNIRAKKVSQER